MAKLDTRSVLNVWTWLGLLWQKAKKRIIVAKLGGPCNCELLCPPVHSLNGSHHDQKKNRMPLGLFQHILINHIIIHSENGQSNQHKWCCTIWHLEYM